MQPDPDYLRQHYNSLSDEALLSINRSDLVEAAQRLYDAEVKERGLVPGKATRRAGGTRPPTGLSEKADELSVQPDDDDEKPEWLEDAALVFSAVVVQGTTAGVECENARRALEAGGIPCYSELRETRSEEVAASPTPTHEWRLMVPGNLNLQAASILDRDIFNEEFEASWRTHLEELSDDDVLALRPEVVFCGLFDRVERVSRAYDEEIARRKLDGNSS